MQDNSNVLKIRIKPKTLPTARKRAAAFGSFFDNLQGQVCILSDNLRYDFVIE